MQLYRHALKNVISWAVRREIFYEEAKRIRGLFDKNQGLTEPRVIDGVLTRGERELWDKIHPDPYIVPYRPGGTLYQRNPPHPPMVQVMDFGREGH
jgi:NADH dehydrogenase (ubiquinone) 1 beta subcomplex subunit 9